MKESAKYRSTLIKMFLIENIGEAMYRALSSKTADTDLAAIYMKLSRNECNTAANVAAELTVLGVPLPKLRRAVLRPLAGGIFAVLSHDVLERLLKRALRKRKFRSWFDQYHQNNEDFWRLMLDHEVLQYKLLKL